MSGIFYNVCSLPPTNGAGFIHLPDHISKDALPYKKNLEMPLSSNLKKYVDLYSKIS